MDGIKKFEEFLDRMQGLLDDAKKRGHIIVRVEDLENTFPELKEKESDKKPNGGIVMEDFNEGNGFYKVNLAYLNKEQVKEIENLVEKWNPELKEAEDEKIRKWLLDFVQGLPNEGLDFHFYNLNKEQVITWLEKQGDKDKLIQELGEYKVKYTQEVLGQYINSMSNKEDERIRKALIEYFNEQCDMSDWNGIYGYQVVAWLEKQESVGEIVERCKDSWYNEGKLQGKIEGLSDEEKYQQGWHDALEKQGEQKPIEWSEEDSVRLQRIIDFLWYNRKGGTDTIYQQEQDIDWLKSLKDRVQPKQSNKPQGKTALETVKEEKVDSANKVEPKFKVGDIVQYITDSTDRRKIEEVDTLCNMYHTDSSPIMFEIEDEWKVVVNAEDVEQNPTDKIESMFKVGDWVVRKDGGVFDNDIKFAQITEIDGEKHWFDTGLICLKAEDMRLWTLEDAKDGDVLVASDGSIFLFKGAIGRACKHYVALTADGVVVINEGLEHFWETSTAVHPATKEQCDTLMKAMTDAEYTFDFEKKELKELKKVEQK